MSTPVRRAPADPTGPFPDPDVDPGLPVHDPGADPDFYPNPDLPGRPDGHPLG